MKIAGVLLAGGASRRFGREKAVAAYGGGLLMDAPLQALIGASDAVAVSAQPGSGAATMARDAGFEVVRDAAGAAAGPLAGILAGLEWAAREGADVLVTAPQRGQQAAWRWPARRRDLSLCWRRGRCASRCRRCGASCRTAPIRRSRP
jgi:hypothetical protein